MPTRHALLTAFFCSLLGFAAAGRYAQGENFILTPSAEPATFEFLLPEAKSSPERAAQQATVDPLLLEIMTLRKELAPELGLAGSGLLTDDGAPLSGTQDFLSALNAVQTASQSNPAGSQAGVSGESDVIDDQMLVSLRQATARRYAQDRLTQLTNFLEQSDLPEESALTRSLADGFLTEGPAESSQAPAEDSQPHPGIFYPSTPVVR